MPKESISGRKGEQKWDKNFPSQSVSSGNSIRAPWRAFTELGERCHDAGPLNERDRRLIKLALSIGAGLEGATHSAVRNAKRAGLSQEEIQHVVVLAITTLGLPSATRAFTWIGDKPKGKKS